MFRLEKDSMVRIINDTDLHTDRLLVLFAKELYTIKHLNYHLIYFHQNVMKVFDIHNNLLLEVNENKGE